MNAVVPKRALSPRKRSTHASPGLTFPARSASSPSSSELNTRAGPLNLFMSASGTAAILMIAPSGASEP